MHKHLSSLESITAACQTVAHNGLYEFLVSVVVAATTLSVGVLITRMVRRTALRYAHSFWRPLLKGNISIVMSQYPNEPAPTGNPELSLAKKLGINYLVSMGNASALAKIMQFLGRELRYNKYSMHGDKELREDSTENTILIGSPATNLYSRSTFRQLMDAFDTVFDVQYDESTVRIVYKRSNTCFEPQIDANGGVDYAIVFRACLPGPDEHWFLMLCGASMWGVEGAAMVVTSPKLLKKAAKFIHVGKNIGFVVKVDIFNNAVHNPEIVRIGVGSGSHVEILKKRKSK